MPSKIRIELTSESQKGTIGNDWKYELEAKIFSGARTGQGTISVPTHSLDSGKTQVPPGPPDPLVLPAGEAGAEISVDLRLSVEEVDLVINDTGATASSFKMKSPAAGGAPVVEERELTVGVDEAPSGVGSAIFKLAIRLTLESD